MTLLTYSDDVFSRVTERWPKVGDRLFSPGHDSFLAEGADERDFRLLRGYKLAGDILIQNALAERSDRDNLIFPALFNYRHYIELALKTIVQDHGTFTGISLALKNHKLPELWQLFLQILAAFGNDCSDAAVMAVGNCIDELVVVDDRSTAFRYARDLSGSTPILPNDGLNLLRLHDVMNGMENFFECAALDFAQKAEFVSADS